MLCGHDHKIFMDLYFLQLIIIIGEQIGCSMENRNCPPGFKNMITDEHRGKLDRNQRDIIVLFKKEGYALASENDRYFSSEN